MSSLLSHRLRTSPVVRTGKEVLKRVAITVPVVVSAVGVLTATDGAVNLTEALQQGMTDQAAVNRATGGNVDRFIVANKDDIVPPCARTPSRFSDSEGRQVFECDEPDPTSLRGLVRTERVATQYSGGQLRARAVLRESKPHLQPVWQFERAKLPPQLPNPSIVDFFLGEPLVTHTEASGSGVIPLGEPQPVSLEQLTGHLATETIAGVSRDIDRLVVYTGRMLTTLARTKDEMTRQIIFQFEQERDNLTDNVCGRLPKPVKDRFGCK